jgi:sulfite exporter TauE/SafE
MNTPSWLIAAGLTAAASIHCVGMCGGFVLALGTRENRLRRLGDQLLLQLGKATTYAFLGALAGAFGAALLSSPAFAWGGRILAVLLATALTLLGLTLLGLRRSRPAAWTIRLASLWQQLLGPLLHERPAGGSLVVGLALGLLPCPLVYAGLAAAVGSGSAGLGAATLAGVALGTVPALTAVALAGASVPQTWRPRLARAAGVLLLAMAVVTLARGLGGHAHHGGGAAPVCHAGAEPARHDH